MSAELFLMSPPGPSWALRGRANFRSRVAEPVDADRAYAEWASLARAIEAAGARVAVLPAVEGLTGLPYCAEAGHPLAPAAPGKKPRLVLPSMWAEHRRAEAGHWRRFAERLGFEIAPAPSRGFWEGQGDVAHFRGRTLLFFGGRTDRDGLDAVRGLFPDDALEIEIREPAFHGNVAVLPCEAVGRLVLCPELIAGDGAAALEEAFGDERLLKISRDEATHYATNALPVGRTLLAPSIAPERVTGELAASGMKIARLPMTELCDKAGGASRCLVCRVPAEIAALLEVPGEATLTATLDRRPAPEATRP